MRDVAKGRGISSAMVSRLCSEMGVPVPPRGFWLRVRSGSIAHPDGKPSEGAVQLLRDVANERSR